jgi:N-methylhydantoinase B
MTALDPTQLAVIEGGLEQATDEMDDVFVETAFSAVIAEGRDRASGVYSPTGDVIVQSSDGLPIFISVMQFTVRSLVAEAPRMEPGDIFLVNDPYSGGTHLMDVRAVAPVFDEGELVGFVANTGHWPDVGGNVAGGYSAAAREVYAEGLQIPPVRIVKGGELDEELLGLILRNVRAADQRRGDVEAQLSAIRIGQERVGAIYQRWGRPAMDEAMRELRVRSEVLMRSCIESVPDGSYEFEDHLDSDGVVDEPLRIVLRVTIEGDEATFDFSGSSPPCEGPMNCVYPTTVSASWIGLKHIFPQVPVNAGSFEPCRFIVPESTFLHAKSPRPVSGCAAEVSQRIVDVVFGALAQAMPEEVPAAAFSTVNNLAIGGEADGREYVVYMYGGGGYGGHSRGDGLTNGPSTVSNAPHPSIEIYEQRAPVLFHRFELREDSAGPGRFRGGFGSIREFELLEGRARASFLGDRGRFAPFGAHGGGAAEMTLLEFSLDGERVVPPHVTKAENVELKAGDRVRIETPGGGGWGDPAERDPAAVRRDLARGYIGEAFATAHYNIEEPAPS